MLLKEIWDGVGDNVNRFVGDNSTVEVSGNIFTDTVSVSYYIGDLFVGSEHETELAENIFAIGWFHSHVGEYGDENFSLQDIMVCIDGGYRFMFLIANLDAYGFDIYSLPSYLKKYVLAYTKDNRKTKGLKKVMNYINRHSTLLTE